MANKKETNTTKKPVAKKTTTKKTTVKKPVKKVEEKTVATKIDVKKDELKKTEIKKVEKVSFKDKVKKFFNSPQPLFIAFTIIIIGLLFYNIQYSKHDSIYIGQYTGDNGSIGTIHIFTNHKINMFYATPATYTGEDQKLYAYEIGYYYEDGDTLKPFIVRSGKMDTEVSVKQIINDNSYFNIYELSSSKSKFTEDAMRKMEKLHFIVYGVTQKDSEEIDYVIDFPVEFNQVV